MGFDGSLDSYATHWPSGDGRIDSYGKRSTSFTTDSAARGTRWARTGSPGARREKRRNANNVASEGPNVRRVNLFIKEISCFLFMGGNETFDRKMEVGDPPLIHQF